MGPEKGVIHLATAAILNAVWDLFAKVRGMPVWRLVAGMTPEELVGLVDFRYLTDALTPDQALDILRAAEPGKAERIAQLEATGYPAYTTSAGWLGYDDDKVRRLCQEALADGFTHFKLKVGRSLEDDLRRTRIAREVIGPDRQLMVDANQVWSVPEAIEWMRALAEVRPMWIEEPTSPDDILGHAAIARAVAPIKVATGRARPQPGHVEAAVPGERHQLRPDRRLPPGQHQRGARGAAAGRPVRGAGLPACRRRRAVRAGRASGSHRLRLRQRHDGRAASWNGSTISTSTSGSPRGCRGPGT